MKTFFTPALLAGLLAALILTLVQAIAVTPLIMQAESFEKNDEHMHADHHADAQEHEHVHESRAWQPEDGWQRTASTASANIVMGVGYGLILVSLFSLRPPQTGLAGLAWGLAGYVVVFVAPGLGLPPELPGTAAADLAARQEWWIGTALATGAGLGLMIFARAGLFKVVGMLLLGLPHFIGAPQPAIAESLAPIALQHQFILVSAVANAIFWAALGFASARIYRHYTSVVVNAGTTATAEAV